LKNFLVVMCCDLQKVLAEILINTKTSKSHLISQFDLGGGIFQSETPLIANVKEKCGKPLTLMKQLILVENNNCIINHVHT